MFECVIEYKTNLRLMLVINGYKYFVGVLIYVFDLDYFKNK